MLAAFWHIFQDDLIVPDKVKDKTGQLGIAALRLYQVREEDGKTLKLTMPFPPPGFHSLFEYTLGETPHRSFILHLYSDAGTGPRSINASSRALNVTMSHSVRPDTG